VRGFRIEGEERRVRRGKERRVRRGEGRRGEERRGEPKFSSCTMWIVALASVTVPRIKDYCS
jgi:hypothetical protein